MEERAFKKYIFTVAHYFVVIIRRNVMEKKIKWRCRGLNTGPFTCKANTVPLSYIAIFEGRAFKKYIFTVAHYFVVMIRAE